MKRLVGWTSLAALLGVASPLGAANRGGPLEVKTVGLNGITQRAYQRHPSTYGVVYDRKLGVYRVPSYRAFMHSSSRAYPLRFTTKPLGALPQTLSFVVKGDWFESFQVAAQGVTLKLTKTPLSHVENVSFHAKGSSTVKRWRVKPGTYFVAASLGKYGEWEVKLTRAAMKLLRYPCAFSVQTQFDRID